MPPRLLGPTDERRVRRWWAAQVTDREMARRLGCHPVTVRKARLRLGLPPWYGTRIGLPHAPAVRDKSRDRLRSLLAARGVARLWQLGEGERGSKARRELAERYGLPGDLYPTAVRVVLALAGGPRTVAELVGLCGRTMPRSNPPVHAFNYRRVPGCNYLTDLVRRGLVARVPQNRGRGNGSGAGPAAYVLTPQCMDLLTRGGSRDGDGDA